MKKILFLALATCSLTYQVQANIVDPESIRYMEKLDSYKYNYENENEKNNSPIVLKHPKNVQMPEQMVDLGHEFNFIKVTLLYEQLIMSYYRNLYHIKDINDQDKKEYYQKDIFCNHKNTAIDYKYFLIANKNIIDQMYAQNPKSQSYSVEIKRANERIQDIESKLSGYDCLKQYIRQ